MSNYNPLASALSAAASELTSTRARRFYVNRAQADIQTAFVLIVQFGCIAYALGAQCRQWVEDMEQSAQAPVYPITLKALPPADSGTVIAGFPITHFLPSVAAPIALLSAGVEKPRRLPANWVGETVLITPAPKAKRTRKPTASKSPAQPTEAPAKGKRGRKPKAAVTA